MSIMPCICRDCPIYVYLEAIKFAGYKSKEMEDKNALTTNITVEVPIETAWELWNNPADIMQWNNTDENWENLKVENDLRPGGRFLFAMAKKDGTEKFDFEGTYDEVVTHQLITYTLDDGRKTELIFTGSNPATITETFDAEPNLPLKMQKEFCQAVLVTFKNYAEGKYGILSKS